MYQSQQPLKIEDFITQRITEMNQFYTQMNLVSPLQQNLQILQSFNQPSHQSSIHFQQSIQLGPPQQSNNRISSPPQKNLKESYVAPQKDLVENQFQTASVSEVKEVKKTMDFDEMPVNGRGRKFEELLEEQLGSQSPSQKRTPRNNQQQQSYLKKKSRKFLSNAAKEPSPESSPQSQSQIVNTSPEPKKSKNVKTVQSPRREEMESTKELRQSLERELSRQKTLTQQNKHLQKKLEMQQVQLQKERELLTEEQARFNSDKLAFIEEERKKWLKQQKQNERMIKASLEQNYKDEIADLKQQLKSTKDYSQMSENNYHGQIVKLKSQVENLLKQRDDKDNQYKEMIEELQEEILFLKEQINNLQSSVHQEQYPLPEQQDVKRPHTVSSNEKPPQIHSEIQMSKSAKQFRASPDAIPKLTINDLAESILKIEDIGSKIDELQFNFDQNPRFKQYLKEKDVKSQLVNKQVDPDGKVHSTFKNGKKEVLFTSGIQKEIFKDGYTVVNFKNKDLKQVFPNGVVVYYFQDANATQTTLPNGQNIYKFYNKQIEIHHPDGVKEIKYQNGVIKVIDADGQEQILIKGESSSSKGIKKRPFK